MQILDIQEETDRMKTKFTQRFAQALVIATLALPSLAHADDYEIDSVHSNVNFKVQHLLSKVSGQFTDVSGTFQFDEKKKAGGDLTVVIKSASINTNNAKRDDHLRSSDFLDVKKHPELSFKSRDVKIVDKSNIEINGDLTIRGVTKPVTLKGTFIGEMKDPGGNHKGGFQATTQINRKDFGIVWNKTLDAGGLVLGDDVEIELLVEAENLTKAKQQAKN